MGAQAILFEMLCTDLYIILSSVVSIHGILEYSFLVFGDEIFYIFE